MTMNTLDCIRTRRSSRKYSNQEVPADVIQRLIELGTMAPTADSKQPWGFAVISGMAEVRSLSDEIKEYLRKNIGQYPQFNDYMGPVQSEKSNLFFGAPCVIIIYGESQWVWSKYDCTLAAGNIILAAHEIGLGSCWVGYAEPYLNSEEGKRRFNVPDSYSAVCAITVGFPKKMLSPPERKPPRIFYIESGKEGL